MFLYDIPFPYFERFFISKVNSWCNDIWELNVGIYYLGNYSPHSFGITDSKHYCKLSWPAIQLINSAKNPAEVRHLQFFLLTIVKESDQFPRWLYFIYLTQQTSNLSAKTACTIDSNLFHLFRLTTVSKISISCFAITSVENFSLHWSDIFFLS